MLKWMSGTLLSLLIMVLSIYRVPLSDTVGMRLFRTIDAGCRGCYR
jgi:hypothetical protein